MPTFGKRNNERPQTGGAFEMYLKTFEDGNSRIRVLEDNPDAWMELKEHFDFGLKISYPCAIHEGFEACHGCNYPVEHEEWEDLDTHFPGLARSVQLDARKKADPGWGVRANPSKWIFPCIDSKGYIAIYKIGFNVWKDFKTKYDVLGSVTGTEFMVTRSGKGFDTSTSVNAVPGEVREPKYAIPGPTEISEVLGKKYAWASEKYGFDGPDLDEPSQPDPAPVTTAPDEAQAGPPPAAPPTSAIAPAAAPVGFIPREASTGEIKDFLAGLTPPVDFPAKAARQVLVGLAEKTITARASEPPF